MNKFASLRYQKIFIIEALVCFHFDICSVFNRKYAQTFPVEKKSTRAYLIHNATAGGCVN